MSNGVKVKNKIFIIAILVIIGMLSMIFQNFNQNQYTSISGEPAITKAGTEEETKNYSVYMMINQLNKMDEASVSGSKVKITLPEGLEHHVYHVTTNEEIEAVEDLYEIPEEGMKLKIDGIQEDNTYDIKIEQAENPEEYESTFKSATIEINAQDGNLVSFVKQIVKANGEEDEVIEGSKEKTALFMYENEENKIKIKGNSDVELLYCESPLNSELTEEELESAEWKAYNKEEGLTVEKNCIIYSKSRYQTEEYSEIAKIYVSNIDKKEPIVEVTTKEGTQYNETSVDVKITDEETEEYGVSGIVAYALTEENVEPEERKYTEYGDGNAEVDLTVSEITENGTYYLWVKDKAGNIGKAEFEIDNILANVAVIILDSSYETLNGTEYSTIESMLQALKTAKESEAEPQETVNVVAQIVRDIKNVEIEVNDETLNMTLDLNGYAITSKEETAPTLKIAKGSVQIVDGKYTIAKYIENAELAEALTARYSAGTENGKIYSKDYIAIEVSEGATLTLGVNDRVALMTPVIEGLEKGIFNNGGTFNFYDGLIIGKRTIDGTITDTPSIFDPTMSQTENEGIFQSYLAKVSGIEATIGKTRYTKIETAISAANTRKGTPEEQVEIDVVSDIIIDGTRGTTDEEGNIISAGSLVIDDTKNILLDLNGYAITNSETEYVMKNYGNLEIMDSSVEETEEEVQSGSIKSTTKSAVYNKGSLILRSGEISGITYGIYNEDDGTVEIRGGKVTASATDYYVYAYGIYNKGTGTVKVTGGQITGSSSNSSYAYGIYNNGVGNVEISGGEVIGNVTYQTYDYVYAYGIYNNSTGIIKVTEGKITGTGNSTYTKSSSYYANGYGIYNNSTGSIEIEGGEITASASRAYSSSYAKSYGIYNSTGTIKLTGGTITSTGNYGYGIWNME